VSSRDELRSDRDGSAAARHAVPDAPPRRRRSRRRRVAVWVGLFWSIGFVTVLAAATFVLATEPGTRWAVQRYLPEGVEVERVEGRLLGPLALHGVRSASDGADLHVDEARLRWRPALLRTRTVHIDALEIRGVEVRQKVVESEAAEPFTLADARMPVAVEIATLSISDLRVWTLDAEEALLVDRIALSATAAGDRIRLSELRISAPEYELSALGDVVTSGRFPLNLELAWSARLPAQPAMSGRGTVQGELLGELRIVHALLDPTPGQLTARVTDALGELAWCAEISVPRFALAAVRDDLGAYHAGAEFTACGDATQATGSGSFAGLLEEFGELSGGLRLAYGAEGLRFDDLQLVLPGGGRLSAAGDARFGEGAPEFRIRGRWSNLGWPFGDPELTTPEGGFEVTGTPERYGLSVDAAVGGRGVPAGRWRVQGRGTPSDFRIDRLAGTTLDGRISGSGTVGWGDEVTWAFTASADDLNPGSFLPDLAGLLGLDLTTRGTIRDGRMRADVQLGRFDGVLRDVPFAVRTDAALDGDRYTLRALELTSGSTLVRATGTVGTSWDLRWEAEAPDLAEFAHLVPELRGRLSGSGELSGPRERPLVTGALLGSDLAVGENSAADLTAAFAVDLADRSPSAVDLRLAGVRSGGLQIDAIELEGSGGHADHSVALRIDAPADSLRLIAAGGVAGGGWAGAIRTLDVRSAAAGTWHLRAPAALSFDAGAARLADLCLDGAAGEACVAGDWSGEHGASADLRAARVPLALFQPLLPSEASIDGLLDLAGSGVMDPEGELRANAWLHAGPGALRFGPDVEGQPIREFDRIFANVDFEPAEMRGELDLSLGDEDRISGHFMVPRGVPPQEQTIQGSLTGSVADRGLLGLLLDDVADSGGTLRIDLLPAGTVAEPRISGTVALEQGRMDLLGLGLRLRDVTLTGTGDGSTIWSLAGGATSGGGSVELQGLLRLPEPTRAQAVASEPWRAEIVARGERFEAFNTPLAHVFASPDLVITASPERIEVTGDLRIPRALITPEEIEPVVPTSVDVVIVGAVDEETAPVQPPIPVHTRVRVIMGDSVQLSGFGLRGRLAGSLMVSDDMSGLTTGRGEIRIVDGSFERFRQRLAIERGSLVFADGPITNPGLDIRVTRRTRDVLAGMNVDGTATAPRVTLFSDPGMAEADVLAYLLLGRPASLASEAEGEFLQNAASSAGLAGSRMIAGRLGSTFGLQDARIEGESLDAASLFLGANLSPRLYVGYGIGLFDAEQLLRIRYQLGRSWVIQSESGATSGADLLYTVER
jgi:translocation and assembly module TamB